MYSISPKHGLELSVSVNEIMMCLQVHYVVIDCIIDESCLNLLSSHRLTHPHQLCKVVID